MPCSTSYFVCDKPTDTWNVCNFVYMYELADYLTFLQYSFKSILALDCTQRKMSLAPLLLTNVPE